MSRAIAETIGFSNLRSRCPSTGRAHRTRCRDHNRLRRPLANQSHLFSVNFGAVSPLLPSRCHLRRPSTAAHLQACGVQAVRAKAAVKAAANSVPRAADVGQRSVGQRSVGEGCVGQRPARQQVKGAARENVVGRDARLREARRAGGVGARQPPCTLPPRPRALGAISRALGAISRTYLSSLAPSSPRQTRRETARASPERSQSWGSLARSR